MAKADLDFLLSFFLVSMDDLTDGGRGGGSRTVRMGHWGKWEIRSAL